MSLTHTPDPARSHHDRRAYVAQLALAGVIPDTDLASIIHAHPLARRPRVYTHLVATFHPAVWTDEDHQADVEADRDEACWKVSLTFFRKLHQAAGLADELIDDRAFAERFDHLTYEVRDALRLDPAAPLWVRAWDGPFRVSIVCTEHA